MTEKIVYDADLGCETIGGSSASDAQMLAQMQMLAGGDDDEDADQEDDVLGELLSTV